VWRSKSRFGLQTENPAPFQAQRDPQLLERFQDRYLPPYSPDLNPIEKAWSKLKQNLRGVKSCTTEALDQAIADALPQITPANALAWFRHGNYRVQLS
jgi:hypothetical protein